MQKVTKAQALLCLESWQAAELDILPTEEEALALFIFLNYRLDQVFVPADLHFSSSEDKHDYSDEYRELIDNEYWEIKKHPLPVLKFLVTIAQIRLAVCDMRPRPQVLYLALSNEKLTPDCFTDDFVIGTMTNWTDNYYVAQGRLQDSSGTILCFDVPNVKICREDDGDLCSEAITARVDWLSLH